MTDSNKRILSVVALLLIGVAALMIFFRPSKANTPPPTAQASPGTEAPLTPPSPRNPVVIPEDFDWNDQDEAWFEELVEQVPAPEDTHSRWNYEFDQIIQPGERIITEGWEVSEGVFQFTTLTSDKVVSDGETLYQISAQVTEIDVSGETDIVSMPRILTRNGMEATLQMVVEQPISNTGEPEGEPESVYYLNVTPKGGTDGIRLQGSASRLVKKP
ncbi:MAG: hypothetical protein HRU46_14990 [Verrucomicrobiales bacterium]|nr:hypothetical protein [Verrucomicrobiales bacterium]